MIRQRSSEREREREREKERERESEREREMGVCLYVLVTSQKDDLTPSLPLFKDHVPTFYGLQGRMVGKKERKKKKKKKRRHTAVSN